MSFWENFWKFGSELVLFLLGLALLFGIGAGIFRLGIWIEERWGSKVAIITLIPALIIFMVTVVAAVETWG